MTEPLPAKFSSTVYHEKVQEKYKAPHEPPTRPSAQSEAVPPSVPAVPATGSAQATWVGRSAASAHLGRASHPPPSSGREQRTSAATRAEAEPAAPAKAPLLSRGHRHRRITPSAAQQRLDWPRHTLAKLKPARPAPQRWRSDGEIARCAGDKAACLMDWVDRRLTPWRSPAGRGLRVPTRWQPWARGAGDRTRTVGALWALPPGSRTRVEVLGRMRGRTDRAAAQSLALGRAGERSVSDTICPPGWLRVKSRRL